MKDRTPIEPVVKQYSAGYKKEAQIQRYQFPRPALVKATYRSQEDTLERALVDMSMSRNKYRMHYVAKQIEGS